MDLRLVYSITFLYLMPASLPRIGWGHIPGLYELDVCIAAAAEQGHVLAVRTRGIDAAHHGLPVVGKSFYDRLDPSLQASWVHTDVSPLRPRPVPLPDRDLSAG